MVVSSAKRTVELGGRTEGRSLMKVENRVGPRIEPWGTPCRRREAQERVGVKNTSNLGAIGEIRLKPKSGRGGQT